MMKKMEKILAIVVLVALSIALTPMSEISAKSKKKMPKNGQTFKSETFKEALGNDLKRCEWVVKKVDGEKEYYPTAIRKSNGARVFGDSMYIKVGSKTYYVDDTGAIVWSNPDNWKVSKYGYILSKKDETPFPGKEHMPQNGETFDSETFKDYLGDDYDGCKWLVCLVAGKTCYKPLGIRKSNGGLLSGQNMYIYVNSLLYYVDQYGYVSWENPDGYAVSEYGYIIPGGDPACVPTEPEPEPEPESDYTIKRESDRFVCLDKNGNYVFGWVNDRYFNQYYGMLLGLQLIDGEAYYFDENIDRFGQTCKNMWIDNMYFGPDGKGYRDGKHVINGKTYYFNSSGFIQTGWVNGEYYSSDPDRYGQLVTTQ